MRNLILIFLCGVLAACTSTEYLKEFPTTDVKHISIHPMINKPAELLGYVEITGNTCKIYLKRYPQCLQHEIRHCFEGNFHEGRKSEEDC